MPIYYKMFLVVYLVHSSSQEKLKNKNLADKYIFESWHHPSLASYFLLRASVFSSAKWKSNSAFFSHREFSENSFKSLYRVSIERMQENKFMLYYIVSFFTAIVTFSIRRLGYFLIGLPETKFIYQRIRRNLHSFTHSFIYLFI